MPAVAPEKFACQMVETALKKLIALIEAAIALPMQAWSVLKAQITTFLNTTLKAIYDQVDQLIKKFYDSLNLDKWDNSKTKANFCQRLWNCKALLLILAEDPLVQQYFPGDPLTIAYETFDKYICRLSLLQLITNFVDGQLDSVRAEIENIIYTAIDKINALIRRYEQFLSNLLVPNPAGVWIKNRNMTVFEWLETLDAFKECALGSCDFVETAINAQADIASKMGLAGDGTFNGDAQVKKEQQTLFGKSQDDDIKQLDMILAERKAKRSTNVVSKSSTMKA